MGIGSTLVSIRTTVPRPDKATQMCSNGVRIASSSRTWPLPVAGGGAELVLVSTPVAQSAVVVKLNDAAWLEPAAITPAVAKAAQSKVLRRSPRERCSFVSMGTFLSIGLSLLLRLQLCCM